MRRQRIASDDSLEVALIEVSDDDFKRIKIAVERFRAATGHNNKTLCDRILSELLDRRLHTETIERLSVWCHTRQPPRKVNDAAESLARELLGDVPKRLLDANQKRVEDYRSLILALTASFEESSAP